MNLKEQILNKLEPLTEQEKYTISKFFSQIYSKKPSLQVNLEVRAVKNIRCIDNGSRAIISIPSAKMESARKWISEEGFIVRAGYTPGGSFWGYKVFLLEEYAV